MTSCKRLSFRVTSEVNKIRQEAFGQILPVFQKELGYVYLHNLAWLKSLKKDSIHKKIMATRDDYVNNNMFDLDEVIAVAVHKKNFLTFSRTMNIKEAMTMKTSLHKLL